MLKLSTDKFCLTRSFENVNSHVFCLVRKCKLLPFVSSGMLKSVTNFASSVSRNMDRLSLDGNHIKRQEESRRHRPDGVSDGLKQGLTGLGISLLGVYLNH